MTKKTLSSPVFAALVFPLAIIYYEALFKAFTTSAFSVYNVGITALFSIFFGMLAFIICTFTGNKIISRILCALLLVLGAVPYLTEYFIYTQFKTFYDLQTVLGGASDMMSGFGEETASAVFSQSGILVLSLFFLPCILFCIFALRHFAGKKIKIRAKLAAAIFSVFVYFLSLTIIECNAPLRLSYGEEYSFDSAIENFGLLSALRLEVREIMHQEEESFEAVEVFSPVEEEEIPEEEPSEPEPEPIVYTPNVMELNMKTDGVSAKIRELNEYVNSRAPSMKNEYTGIFEGKNLIFITAEAFSAEVINPELTPTLYRLSTKGINFTDYYQFAGAGTTGGEYQNIFGMLPTKGGMSFKSTDDNLNYFTIANQLARLGYYGKAYHNNDYTYYSRHKTHINIGYSDGFMGYGNGIEEFVTKQWPQSDFEMIAGTVDSYIDKAPFSVYYMTVSGHGRYGKGSNAMSRKNWDKVAHLEYSDTVKGYIAACLELEAALSHLVARLEEKGIADDTVICISTDHFPYGLDDDGGYGNMPYLSELYGYEVTNIFQRDHSRLILWCGELEDKEPVIVDSPTSSLDILPTLSNLFGTEFDSRLMAGRDVFSDAPALVYTLNYDWKTDYGTFVGGKFIPKDESTVLPDGYIDSIKTEVRNRVKFCKSVLDTDYFRYLFESETKEEEIG